MTVENLGIVDLMLNHYLSSFLVIKTTRFSQLLINSLLRTEISEILSKETGPLQVATSALAAGLTHHRIPIHLSSGWAGRADWKIKLYQSKPGRCLHSLAYNNT